MKTIRSKAPLRLGLAGGGSDVSPYCDIYGGYVLNATINMYAHCTLIPTNDSTIEFEALDREVRERYDLNVSIDMQEGLSLHKAVYLHVIKNYNDGKPLSHKVITYSDAPPGSGLGSSSTLVVAILQAYVEWLNLPLGEYDVAYLAFVIERIELGQQGGRQDQYAAAFGGFNFMEFYKDNRVIVNPLRVRDHVIQEMETAMVLYYTNVSRYSSDIIKEQVKHIEDKDSDAVESTHKLKQGALEYKEALLKGQLNKIAESMQLAWEAKKRIASHITSPEIEQAFETAMANGAYAGKVSGAGGGGFIVFFVSPLKKLQVLRTLGQLGGRVMPFQFTASGACSWKGVFKS